MILIRRCIRFRFTKTTHKPLFTRNAFNNTDNTQAHNTQAHNTQAHNTSKDSTETIKITKQSINQILESKKIDMTQFKLTIELQSARAPQALLQLLTSYEWMLNEAHLTAALKCYQYMPHHRKLHHFIVQWVRYNWKSLRLGQHDSNTIAAVVWHLRSQPSLKQQIINVQWERVFANLTDQQFTMVVNGLMMNRWDSQVFKRISMRKGNNKANEMTMAVLLQRYVTTKFHPALILSIWRHYIKYHPEQEISIFLGRMMTSTIIRADFSNNLADYAYLLQVYVSEHSKIDQQTKSKIEAIIAIIPRHQSIFETDIKETDIKETDAKQTDRRQRGLQAQHFCILADSWRKTTKITKIVRHNMLYRYIIQQYNQLLSIKLDFLRQLSNSYYYFIINYSKMENPTLERTGHKYVEICQAYIQQYRNRKAQDSKQTSIQTGNDKTMPDVNTAMMDNSFRQKSKRYDAVTQRIDPQSIRLFFPQIINALIADGLLTGIIAKIGHSTMNVLQIYQEEGVLFSDSYHEGFHSQILFGALLINRHFKSLRQPTLFDDSHLKLMKNISEQAICRLDNNNIGKFSSCLAGLDIKTPATCKYTKQRYYAMNQSERDTFFGKDRDKQTCFMNKTDPSKCVCIK